MLVSQIITVCLMLLGNLSFSALRGVFSISSPVIYSLQQDFRSAYIMCKGKV